MVLCSWLADGSPLRGVRGRASSDRRQWSEVAELVRVDDRAHRLDPAVGDVERDDVNQAAFRIQELRARLAIDMHRLRADAQVGAEAEPGVQQLDEAFAPVDRALHARALVAAVAVE